MAVEFLHELNVPFFKVGSGDTNNFPYLEKTAKKGERLVLLVELCFKVRHRSLQRILECQSANKY